MSLNSLVAPALGAFPPFNIDLGINFVTKVFSFNEILGDGISSVKNVWSGKERWLVTLVDPEIVGLATQGKFGGLFGGALSLGGIPSLGSITDVLSGSLGDLGGSLLGDLGGDLISGALDSPLLEGFNPLDLAGSITGDLDNAVLAAGIEAAGGLTDGFNFEGALGDAFGSVSGMVGDSLSGISFPSSVSDLMGGVSGFGLSNMSGALGASLTNLSGLVPLPSLGSVLTSAISGTGLSASLNSAVSTALSGVSLNSVIPAGLSNMVSGSLSESLGPLAGAVNGAIGNLPSVPSPSAIIGSASRAAQGAATAAANQATAYAQGAISTAFNSPSLAGGGLPGG